MDRLGDQVRHLGHLVTAELPPLLVQRGVFLLPGVISVLFLELTQHFRMIPIIPGGIFAVLDNAVGRPQRSGQHHIHQPVVVDRDAIQAVHLTIRLDFLVDVFPHFGQRGTQELIVPHISGRVGQAFPVTVHTEPLRMLLQDAVTVVLQVHGPQPCIHFDSVAVSDRDSDAVIVRRGCVQHHSVNAHVVHDLTDGIKIHTGPVIEPCPEHRILLLRLLGRLAGHQAYSHKQCHDGGNKR